MLSDFKFVKEFGKGAFSSVHLVIRKHDNLEYAMKRVKVSQLNEKEKENALNEIQILSSINHPNIIAYKEAFYDYESNTLNLVMEYAGDGDMENRIKLKIIEKKYFKEEELWNYLAQITLGLKCLHDSKIMHRDLKSANVFIKGKELKLGDLNVSKVIQMGLAYTQTGTPYYASPEVWSDKPYEYKSDIWSMGCVLYEICTFKPPFKGNNLDELYKNIMKGVFDAIPNCYSRELNEIISSMLRKNPKERWSLEMILSHPKVKKAVKEFYSQDLIEKMNLGLFINNEIKSLKIVFPKDTKQIGNMLPKNKLYK